MKINFKLQNLEKFTKIVNSIDYQEAHIGFLGEEKNTRSEGQITNANLGAIHHFGSRTKNLPPRSPFIGFQMNEKTEEINSIVWQSLESSLSKGMLAKADITKALKLGGIGGENLIDDAFNTAGFGTWASIKSSTSKRKGNDKILIETDQLHKARVSKVVNK